MSHDQPVLKPWVRNTLNTMLGFVIISTLVASLVALVMANNAGAPWWAMLLLCITCLFWAGGISAACLLKMAELNETPQRFDAMQAKLHTLFFWWLGSNPSGNGFLRFLFIIFWPFIIIIILCEILRGNYPAWALHKPTTPATNAPPSEGDEWHGPQH
jgi:hypothetical protein